MKPSVHKVLYSSNLLNFVVTSILSENILYQIHMIMSHCSNHQLDLGSSTFMLSYMRIDKVAARLQGNTGTCIFFHFSNHLSKY